MPQSLPPLTPSQRHLLEEGIRLFNREQFFECHEALEAAWLEGSGEQKTFLQGLIQVAVAFHHLRRANYLGAGRLLAAGMTKLAPFAPAQEAVPVGSLLDTLEPLRQKIASGEAASDWPAPQIHWKLDWKPLPISSTE